eukprot:TRINITY_DN33031_c0_g1_i1.p1 TRINITY_DN33031_c0_g1~~TRINITY_DN33031_c0_g1_i1.p1  ORF type:complete len:319 (-),score=101.60 TRINITY_DN33031_c0_g1_i1:3-959(-)
MPKADASAKPDEADAMEYYGVMVTVDADDVITSVPSLEPDFQEFVKDPLVDELEGWHKDEVDDQADDDKVWWSIKACPGWFLCNDNRKPISPCSSESWKKARCGSYYGPHIARARLYNHLWISGKHHHLWKEYPKDKIIELIMDADVLGELHTGAERKTWRQEQQAEDEKHAAKQKTAQHGKGLGKGAARILAKRKRDDEPPHPKRGKNDGDAPAQLLAMPPAPKQLFPEATTPGAVPLPLCVSAPVVRNVDANKKVTITVGQAATMQDAVVRAMWSVGSCQQQLLTAARTLQNQNEILAAVLQQVQQLTGDLTTAQQ